MRKILYITYDGLTDSLGQSQILAYLKRLAKLENEVVILSYEKETLKKKEGERIRSIVETNGLTWIPLRYTKRPPVLSTLLDINKGIKACKKLLTQHRFEVVHCRGYIAAIIGKKLKKDFGTKFIFDMRGWWPDEKLESGFWDKKMYRPVYNYFKKLEKKFFEQSDFIVSLTYRGKEEIVSKNFAPAEKVGVIPTCVDFEIFKAPSKKFRNSMKQKLGIGEKEKIFIYSGSLGGNYDLEILIDVFLAYKKIYPNSFLLILSKEEPFTELQSQFANAGINRVAIYSAPFTEVTNYLRVGDIGFIYYKMSFSVIGRSPTKMGEYWASGMPVIAFSGIGDLDYILAKYPGSGLLLDNKKEHWEEDLKNWRGVDDCTLRGYAVDYFHINKGVKFYQKIYESITSST